MRRNNAPKTINENVSKLGELITLRNSQQAQSRRRDENDFTEQLSSLEQSLQDILPRVRSEIDLIKNELLRKNVGIDFSDKISEIETRIGKIFGKIDKLSQELLSINENNPRIDELQNQVRTLTVSNSKLTSVLNDIQTEINSYEDDDNTEILAIIQTNKKEVSTIKNSLNIVQDQTVDNSRKISDADSSLNVQKKEIIALKNSIEELKTEEKIDINPVKRDINVLKSQIVGLSEQIKIQEQSSENDNFKREILMLKNQGMNLIEMLKSGLAELTNTIAEIDTSLKILISKELKNIQRENSKNLENLEISLNEKLSDLKLKTDKISKDSARTSDDISIKLNSEIQILKNEIRSLSNFIERSRSSEKNIEQRLSEFAREFDINSQKNDCREETNREFRELKRSISNLIDDKNILAKKIDFLENSMKEEKGEEKFEPKLSELTIEEENVDFKIEETKKQMKDLMEIKFKNLESQIKENNSRIQIEKLEHKIIKNSEKIQTIEQSRTDDEMARRIEFLERKITDEPHIDETDEESKKHPDKSIRRLEREVHEIICRINRGECQDIDKKFKKLEQEIHEINKHMVTKCELDKSLREMEEETNQKLKEIDEKINLLDDEIKVKISVLTRDTENNKKLIAILDSNIKKLSDGIKESISDLYCKYNKLLETINSIKDEIRETKCELEKLDNRLLELKIGTELSDKKIDHNFILVKRMIDDLQKKQEALDIFTNEKFEQMNEKITEQNDRLTILEAAISLQATKLNEVVKRISTLEAIVGHADNKNLICEINEIINKNMKQDRDIYSLNDKIELIDGRLNCVEKNIESLEREEDMTKMSLSTLIKDVRDQNDEICRLKNTDTELIKIVKKAEEQINSIDKKLLNVQDLTIEEFKIIEEKIKYIQENEEEMNEKLAILIEGTNCKEHCVKKHKKFDEIDYEIKTLESKAQESKEKTELEFLDIKAKMSALNLAIEHINLVDNELTHKNSVEICEIKGILETLKCLDYRHEIDKLIEGNSNEFCEIKDQLKCFCHYIDGNEQFKHSIDEKLKMVENSSGKVSSPCLETVENKDGCHIFSNPEKSCSFAIYPGFNALTKRKAKDCISLFGRETKKLFILGKVFIADAMIEELKSGKLEITETINKIPINRCLINKNEKSIEVAANHMFIVKTGCEIVGLNVFYCDWLVPASYKTYIWRQINEIEIEIRCFSAIAKNIDGNDVISGTYNLKWF